MFDLEQAISDWREQMLVAGIPTPALDELEGHLREDIRQRTQTGTAGEVAFSSAFEQLGSIKALKIEFARSRPWYGDGHASTSDRIIGIWWTTTSVWPLYYMSRYFWQEVTIHPSGLA